MSRPDPRTEPLGTPSSAPLSATRRQPVTVLTWTDTAGPHEVAIDRATTLGAVLVRDAIVVADVQDGTKPLRDAA